MFIVRNDLSLILCLLLVYSVIITPYSVYSTDYTADEIETDQNSSLNILTRHSLDLTGQFTTAFLESEFAKEVNLTTSDDDKIKFVQQASSQDWIDLMSDKTSAIDLAWGGGPTLFNQLKNANVLKQVDSNIISFLNGLNISERFGGVSIYDTNDNKTVQWISNVFSSFGFTVNRDLIEEYGLIFPTSWKDLADPSFYVEGIHTVGVGNAPDSTSITRIYEIILQTFGWVKGWELILSMVGNGDIIGGSSATRDAVINNEVLVSMTIDFYGLIAQNKNPSTEYVLPIGESYVSGDPIAFGINGKSPDIAEAFFKFTFSEVGQAIWVKNNVVPINIDSFNHPSVSNRSDIKDLYNKTVNYNSIEFDESLALSRDFTIKNYFEAVATIPQAELKAGWASLISQMKSEEISKSEFAGFISVMFEPQITVSEAKNINSRLGSDEAYSEELINTWSNTSITRYNAFAQTDVKSDNKIFNWLHFMNLITPILILIVLLRLRTNRR